MESYQGNAGLAFGLEEKNHIMKKKIPIILLAGLLIGTALLGAESAGGPLMSEDL